MQSRRELLLQGATALLAGKMLQPGQSTIFTPEAFGAKGDGVTNDSAAFEKLSKAVCKQGGGQIVLRPVTYIVGGQIWRRSEKRDWAFEPVTLLHFKDCTKPVSLEGNGARLLAVADLKYGAFNRTTGKASKSRMPNYEMSERASPYDYMILAEGCTGGIRISDIELDGNISRMQIGGEYGDVGRQVSASGIFLRNNRCDELISDVYSHHHGLDGLIIDGDDNPQIARNVKRQIIRLRAEYNGRQGCSIVGGWGYEFLSCKFNHTGKSKVASGPGAGVDIEAEGGKLNRKHRFDLCEFVNNYGPGMISDSGDSQDVDFTRCRFVGSTSWSVWPAKPGFRFDDCKFVGPLVRTFSNADPALATQFKNCQFTDDPSLSPTGSIYDGGTANCPIVNADTGTNVLFDTCDFSLIGAGTLPWSVKAIYKDCKMKQRATTASYPRGRFLGTNRIDGNAMISGSMNKGTLILNGKQFRGPKIA